MPTIVNFQSLYNSHSGTIQRFTKIDTRHLFRNNATKHFKGNKMKRFAIALLAAAFMTGCANNTYTERSNNIRQQHEEFVAWQKTVPETSSDHGAYPKNYKNIIQESLKRSLKDPDSAKYSNFTVPKKTYAILASGVKEATYGYTVCVYVNAKNSYGGYTGNHMFWFFIKDGVILKESDLTEGKYSKMLYQNDLNRCLLKKS